MRHENTLKIIFEMHEQWVGLSSAISACIDDSIQFNSSHLLIARLFILNESNAEYAKRLNRLENAKKIVEKIKLENRRKTNRLAMRNVTNNGFDYFI